VLIPVLKAVEPAIRRVLGFLPFFQGPFYGVSVLAADGVCSAIMIIVSIPSRGQHADSVERTLKERQKPSTRRMAGSTAFRTGISTKTPNNP